MITMGLDVGSLATKAVLVDEENRILGYGIELTSGNSRQAAETVFDKVIKKSGISKESISYIITTGYGRDNVLFADRQITEITCHAMGAYFLFSGTRTVLDIGGQDSKAINLSNDGQVSDFVMNDKCAAGTGRFLEVMAHAMAVKLEDLGSLSAQSKKNIPVSSMCTVFAESEVVSLVAEGCPKPDIIRGIHEAIAEKAITLLNKIKMIEPITMTGGVAKDRGIVRALEKKLKLKMNISDEPQIVGAIGAAIIAHKFVNKDFSFMTL